MDILSLRFGFATNSSSSHSVIFPKVLMEDVNESSEFDFGWDNFILSSNDAKIRYLSIILKNNLKLPNFINKEIIRSWMDYSSQDMDFSDYQIDQILDGYIDHQSFWTLPYCFGTDIVDPEFFKDFKDYIMQRGLTIVGGNDNDDGDFIYGKQSILQKDQNYVCRKDVRGNYWSLFNKENGNKIKIRFNPSEDIEVANIKSEVPELIDIKITDYCNQECSFCYTGSNTKGKHADFGYWGLFKTLEEMKVFEVCLGGGEPTDHPDFIDILKESNSNGISTSFTTKKKDWLRDPKKWIPIMDNCSAFGFTPVNIDAKYNYKIKDELGIFHNLLFNNGISRDRVKIHVPMGVVSKNVFEEIIDFCKKYKYSILLLGFKKTGRALNFKKINYSDFLTKFIKSNENIQIGIDTVLAKEIKPLLDSLKVPKFLYSIKEGVDSCFIDMVSLEMSESSFSDKRYKLDVFTIEKLKDTFNIIQNEKGD